MRKGLNDICYHPSFGSTVTSILSAHVDTCQTKNRHATSCVSEQNYHYIYIYWWYGEIKSSEFLKTGIISQIKNMHSCRICLIDIM